jgi:hypothetical protein
MDVAFMGKVFETSPGTHISGNRVNRDLAEN